MAEVADRAGLAKGTVYLYFPSKDELLVALHERHVDAFFAALLARLDQPTTLTLDEMRALTTEHMISQPTFLPLATLCFGLMETEIPREVASAFKQRMTERLTRAGAGLERHFPVLRAGDGIALLRHSYALIVGLWQMSAAQARAEDDAVCVGAEFDYPAELHRALNALWRGTIGDALEATPRVAISEAGRS
jgi:AcrR family transcriptional regulator